MRQIKIILTGVTLAAMINIDGESVASVTPVEITDVIANEPRMFTVEGLKLGSATLTLIASHSDYISADTTVKCKCEPASGCIEIQD